MERNNHPGALVRYGRDRLELASPRQPSVPRMDDCRWTI